MLNANTYIGNYRIIKELSRGASGIVYLGQHAHLTNRIVAIKLLQLAYLPSQQDREGFLREASFLELLKHPFILPIYDVGIHEGFPYIIAEYAPNGSLKDRLQMIAPALLPAQDILRALTQVGQALHFAHQRNIIHRDIKPANILFNANGDALLADFNIAMQLEQTGTQHADTSGTPFYMAPEQFEGIVSKKSDQYALGCIAYELVTGQRPFTALDWHVLAIKHAREIPIPPSQFNQRIPRYVEAAILKAMAKDRNERHEDVQAFILALGNQQAISPLPLAQSDPNQTSSLSETNIPTIQSSQPISGIIPPVEPTPRPITPLPLSQTVPQQSLPGINAQEYYPPLPASQVYPASPVPSELQRGNTDPQSRHNPVTPVPTPIPMFQESNVPVAPIEQRTPSPQEIGAVAALGANYNPVPPMNRVQDNKPGSKRGLLLIVTSIILVLLVAGGGTLYALSRVSGGSNQPTTPTPAIGSASVTITPLSKTIQKTFTILEVTGNPDSSQQQVAGAHYLTFTTTPQYTTVNATGHGTHPAVEATGVLTYTSHLTSADTFNSGDTVTSNSPNIVAVITQTKTINPGQTLTFNAYISTPTGSHSNVAAGAMNGSYCLNDPKCPGDGIYIALTSSAFTGGQDPQPYVYVQQADLNAAQGNATGMEPALEQQGQAGINAQLKSQERLIGTPTCTPSINSNHKADDIASSVTDSVMVQCTGEAYNPQNALTLAQTILKSDPSYAFVGKVTTTLQKVGKPTAQGIIPMIYQSTGLEVFQFSDSYKQTLIGSIVGKSTQDARSFLLTQMGVKDVTITFVGGQVNTLPTKTSQITLTVSSQT